MANYRQIHTCIWKDAWFLDLEADHKLLWIYLFSNERANLTGLYDLHKRIIAFETGLPLDTIDAGFDAFEKAGKAYYEDGWVWVPNLIKYNAGSLNSEKIRTHIVGALSKIADSPIKGRCIEHYNSLVGDAYRIDTLSIPYPTGYAEQEQEQEQTTEGADAPTQTPSTFEQWRDGYRSAEKPNSYAGLMLKTLYPGYYKGTVKPNYGMLGGLLKKYDAEYVLSLIFQNSARPPSGDPIKFVAGIVAKNPERADTRPKQKFVTVGGES